MKNEERRMRNEIPFSVPHFPFFVLRSSNRFHRRHQRGIQRQRFVDFIGRIGDRVDSSIADDCVGGALAVE